MEDIREVEAYGNEIVENNHGEVKRFRFFDDDGNELYVWNHYHDDLYIPKTTSYQLEDD